jgi:hypothetical protein
MRIPVNIFINSEPFDLCENEHGDFGIAPSNNDLMAS